MKHQVVLKPGWTRDRILETIKSRNNGKPSMHDNICCYRDPTGNACAIGAFIPDHEMSEIRDLGNNHESVEALLYESPHLKKYMPSENLGFLQRLQHSHDRVGTMGFKGGVYASVAMLLDQCDFIESEQTV